MIEKITYNNTSLILPPNTQRTNNYKISKTQNDEIFTNKNREKKKGNKILKTILGVGGSSAIGGLSGKFLFEKNAEKIKCKLTENMENLYDELWNFKDSSAVTEQGKQNYSELTSVLHGINKYNGSNYKCMLFEGNDKKSADKIMDWIGNVCNKEYGIFDMDVEDIYDVLQGGDKFEKLHLFRAENMDKYIKKDNKNSIIATMKDWMSCCGQQETNAILMFHSKDFNEIHDEVMVPHRISKHFKVDEMKDFDKYTDLYKKFQNTEKKLSNISKTTKTKFIVAGIVAGLAVATGIFAFLKIKNKGKRNENITTSNK